jgi:hypothetical protein
VALALALRGDVQVEATYCKGLEDSLSQVVASERGDTRMRKMHLEARLRSERFFFGSHLEAMSDCSNPIQLDADINFPPNVQALIALQPDLVVAYGCSIIREPLLTAFEGRLLNLHLGLSPRYYGAGTNYWPLVNGEPEYVGATFMHMNAGVDTGTIIHQIRAHVERGDQPADIGNRLIMDAVPACARIVRRFDELPSVPQPPKDLAARQYRRRDYSEQSVRRLYQSFPAVLERYLNERDEREARAPIVENPLV